MQKVIFFALGVTAGSLITWKLVDEKYKRLAAEEIDAVREYYKNKDKEKKEALVEKYIETNKVDNTVTEYSKAVSDLGYSVNKHTNYIEPEKESEDEMVEPYIISPDEFGETQYFENKNWTYYADFVLVDEDDDIVVDYENIIGDALEHFGEFEDDAVHVRNENLMCDIEILKDEKTFAEINREDN